ncbi:Uncharacterised protein [Mycoplasmopsis citelli]|uniref:Uncharacterized protein n=1 Tax=Mycoplasmopsis citelli TaxID=171281 RepID=A0A449B2P0_9BACT|nr:hypothetical protein [Mycoplasmopsis citelli]VEU74843.1 Uncharacterised protein [Mycoplasmopsis citelli]
MQFQVQENKGVDYTNIELDLKFGKVLEKKQEIFPINNNFQTLDNYKITEEKARDDYQKWENVKHICEGILGPKGKPRKGKKVGNSQGNWGFSVKKKSRLSSS